jgi:hypothetical protein
LFWDSDGITIFKDGDCNLISQSVEIFDMVLVCIDGISDEGHGKRAGQGSPLHKDLASFLAVPGSSQIWISFHWFTDLKEGMEEVKEQKR